MHSNKNLRKNKNNVETGSGWTGLYAPKMNLKWMYYVKLKLRLPVPVRLAFQLNFTSSFCQNLTKLFLQLLTLLLSTTQSGRLFHIWITLLQWTITTVKRLTYSDKNNIMLWKCDRDRYSLAMKGRLPYRNIVQSEQHNILQERCISWISSRCDNQLLDRTL